MGDHSDPCGSAQVLESEIVNIKRIQEGHAAAIHALQNRPPVWTTIVIAILTAYGGWLSGYAFGLTGLTGS